MLGILVVLGAITLVAVLTSLSTSMRLAELSHRLSALEGRVANATPDPWRASRANVADPSSVPVAAAAPPQPPPSPQLALVPALVTPPLPPPPPPPSPPSPTTSPSPATPPPSPGGWAGLEQHIGRRWTTWAGALALFVAVALFLQLAAGEGWLGILTRIGGRARTVGAAALGLALLGAGHRGLAGTMRALGQGLVGAGLAMLYAAIWAGASLYHLYPQPIAFALLIGVTATGAALAIRHDALPIALLAVLGGLATPVMVATGAPVRDALFGYLTVLDLGVLAIAWYRGWRILDAVAAIGTWALFVAWYVTAPRPIVVAPTLLWLTVLWAIFAIVPYAYHLRRGVPVTGERLLVAVGNALVAFAIVHDVVGGGHRAGVVALALGAAYLTLGHLVRRRLPDDPRALLGFVTLAVGFVTLAVPLHLRDHGVFHAWAIEAPVLIALGFHYRYRPVRLAGLIVLGLAALRLVDDDVAATGALFLNPGFAGMALVAASAAACAWLLRRDRDPAARDRGFAELATLGAVALLGAAISLDLWHHLRATAIDAGATDGTATWRAQTGLSVAWACYAGALIVVGFRWRLRLLRLAGLALFGVTAAKLVMVDLASVHRMYRVLSFLALGTLMIGASYLYHRRGAERGA
ncbi:MAG: DUF2339 domain-containing protein [Kofleriaceae bacterium]|nr:DUF2339 domain-containing protein [Myxococcales bacterium]MCB9561815.1 DUF2339 domain-containing protein [Kofleriaceae bacterium]